MASIKHNDTGQAVYMLWITMGGENVFFFLKTLGFGSSTWQNVVRLDRLVAKWSNLQDKTIDTHSIYSATTWIIRLILFQCRIKSSRH